TLVRLHRSEILEEWERDVRSIPRTQDLGPPALIDHIPSLLDHIAQMTEQLAAGETPDLPRPAAARHAVSRLHEGMDLIAVVREYGVLRQAILRVWEHSGAPISIREVHVLDDALDRSIAA